YFTETHTSKPHWLAIDTFANQCHFAHAIGFTQLPTHTVFCLSYRAKHSGQEQDVLQRQPSNHRHNPLQLVRFDPPQKTPTVVLDYAVDLFTFDRYMAVTVARGTSLALFVSVDGTTFKEAQFPPQVSVTPNQFTLFQTATGAVFVDVLRSTDQGQEYGSLFVSNLDGTYYNLVLTDTNRDHTGLVDFEPVPGVQGIVLANRVANADALGQVGQRKAVQSMVSFTDGRTWARISAPLVDAREKRYECGQECYVNLHGYTDVTDADSMLKTAAAPGLMVAVGSVGPQLAPYEQSNTFITANAGRSWKEIRRGPFRHALGDHGALVVLVNDATATNQVVYSWDRGATWSSYVFSDHPVRVTSLITAGDATSLKFLITGYRLSTVGDHRTALIALDFSGTTLRRCTLNIHESDPNDFELWTPGANVDERCHMGKEVSYWRRKANALCT
ncbi:vacuolar protein sorting/targeting protein PEP1, partial [Dimargaris verticillata]